MSAEPEEDEGGVSPELYLGDGEFWLADSVAFCEKHNVDGFLSVAGSVFALINGKGWANVEDLVKGKRMSAVRSIGEAK